MEYWTSEGLSFIASGIGIPLYMDSVTEAKSRLHFAKVCVELDFQDDMPSSITFDMGKGS